MANAHIIFGRVKRDGILDSTFTSETVASGATSAATVGTVSVANITAVGGNIYVAFGTGTPSASANPRAFVPQNGSIDVSVAIGTKIDVLDA